MTREEAIARIEIDLRCADCGEYCYDKNNHSICKYNEVKENLSLTEAQKMAIKALEQEPVIDKIRAEIETKYGQCKLTEYIVQYDGICTSANEIGDIADILQIIDKYKAETEEI